MYAKVKKGAVVKYPFTQADLQAQYPTSSVPTTWLPEFMDLEGIVHVVAKGQPDFDPATQTVIEATPTFNKAKKQWEQSWSVGGQAEKPPEE